MKFPHPREVKYKQSCHKDIQSSHMFCKFWRENVCVSRVGIVG